MDVPNRFTMKIFYILLYILTLYPSTSFANTVIVKRVINAHIIELVNGEKVRLIGIKCSNKKFNRTEKRDIRVFNIHGSYYSKSGSVCSAKNAENLG